MPVVSCPYCTNPVSLPTPWNSPAYTCPHCQNTVATSPPPPPAPAPRSMPTPAPMQMAVQSYSPPVVVSPPPPPQPAYDEEFDDSLSRTSRRKQTGSPFIEFASFRLMIAPLIIQIVFWIGVAVCVIQGGSVMISSFSVPAPYDSRNIDRDDDDYSGNTKPGTKSKAKQSPPTRFSFALFGTGLLIMFIGPLLIRLACEFYILLFKIHDELKLSNDREKYRS